MHWKPWSSTDGIGCSKGGVNTWISESQECAKGACNIGERRSTRCESPSVDENRFFQSTISSACHRVDLAN
jgi:hypothetical protein